MRHAVVLLLLAHAFAASVIADDLVTGDWVEHGFDADAKRTLHSHLHEGVRFGDVPGGAVLLLHRGEVIFREGFGHGHIRRQVPFKADSPFRVASISKSIIATLTVKLDADGKLDLDKPIDAYLPQMKSLRLESGTPPKRAATLRECLKHTAGFATDYGDQGRPWLQQTGKGLTLENVVELEATIPLSRNPGERFAYSGIGYDVVGRIIEVAVGRPLDDVLRMELCEPLGMTRTTYYPNAATRDVMPSFYWQWRSDGKFRRRLDQPPVPVGEYVSVGGGIVSTADDLARFMLLHRNHGMHEAKQLIAAEALDAMYKRQKPGTYYGLGFTLGPTGDDGLAAWIYHSGSSGTMLWLDRERDVIGVIATQHSRSDGEPIPESDKLISRDTPSWQASTKQDFIDPILGWTGTSVSNGASSR